MKRVLSACCLASLLALPTLIHAEDHSQHNHGTMQMMPSQSIPLGEQTTDGVKGKALLKDMGAMMAQMGRKENFHFMIMFSEAATGKPVEQGTVAVKIVDPKTGQAGEPISLEGMGNHFGADIALLDKGEYQFQVGTKLGDGVKRQFVFKQVVK